MKLSNTQRERRINRKKVIDALRDRSWRYTKLVNEIGISEKTLDRILDELKTYGLVMKRGGRFGYWTWYDQVRNRESFESTFQYNRYMEHCQALIPTFNLLLRLPVILGIGLDNPKYSAKKYMRFVEEHLRKGYPDIFNRLIDYRKLVKKERQTTDKLRDKLIEKSLSELEERLRLIKPSQRFKRITSKSAKPIAEGIASRIVNRITKRIATDQSFRNSKNPLDYILKEPDFILDGGHQNFLDESFLEKTIREVKVEVEELQKVWSKIINVGSDLSGDINLIIMRVEMEDPLQATCELCENFHLTDIKSKGDITH